MLYDLKQNIFKLILGRKKNPIFKIYGGRMMYQIYKPNHIGTEYINFILFKICPTWEYLTDFVNGRFYMNTNLFFSKNEKKGCLTDAQFDELEGTETLLNSTKDEELVIDFSEEKPRIIQGKRGEFDYKGTPIINAELGKNKPVNIYCMYSVWNGRQNDIITKVDTRIMTEFGNYFAIVLNRTEFLNRIENALKQLPYRLKTDLQYQFVNYVDTENQSYVNLGVFNKDKKYTFQNEFRIALEIDRDPAPLKYFEVGDLSDIVLIGKTEYLLNIEFKENNLKIGKTQIPVVWDE